MKKGFVVSAVLYPLLVMFLVLVMGILAMGQNRRKILDNMKLEVSEESETDPEMSNSALYYKMKVLEEAYAEMSSRLSEERFEEMQESIQKDYESKINTAKNQAISNATTSSNNYTNNSINNLTTTVNSMRTSLQSEINTAKSSAISTAKTQTKLEAFPVGSIFTSTTSTNPSSYIGGTWEAYGEGRTLVGVGNNGTTTYSLGTTGGSESHVHGSLNTANGTLEAMIGSYQGRADTIAFKASNKNSTIRSTYSVAGSNNSVSTVNSHNTVVYGATASGNSMQPYIVVYYWKRTS